MLKTTNNIIVAQQQLSIDDLAEQYSVQCCLQPALVCPQAFGLNWR